MKLKNRKKAKKKKGESNELHTASLFKQVTCTEQVSRATITIYIFTYYLEKTKLLQLG